MTDDTVNLRDWIGREQHREDQITIAPLIALSATLDRDDADPRVGDALPPLWHWLFFLPRTSTRELGADGHTTLGSFFPPVSLPRRMWAGSRLVFEHEPRVGEQVTRVSRIADVTEKTGASGPLVFVSVEHDIHTPRGLAIREQQDIVYRDLPGTRDATARATSRTSSSPSDLAKRDSVPAQPGVSFHRTITPDPVLLFRYSALTFNSHRIHYDRRYVMDVEAYPGLLVHGPLLATLLLDLLRREKPEAHVREFSFKARRPLFDTAPFVVHGAAVDATRFTLEARDLDGAVAVEATATID